MSTKSRALTSALKAAHREEVRAVTFFGSAAAGVKDARLIGTFRQFGSQGMGGVATVEALLDSRGAGRPLMLAFTRLRAALQGRTARVRPRRALVEDALDRAEAREKCMAEAAGSARIAGDLDAARSLDGLRETAASQATWLREFLR